jgi:hypothetical protein
MVFGSAETDFGLGLGLLNSGVPNQVNGTYRVVMTTANDAGQVTTWRGRFNFALGCIQAGSGLEPMEGAGSLEVPESGSCFDTNNDLFELDFVAAPVGAQERDYKWFGAIGPRGDTMVFTNEANGLQYGVVVLIREVSNASPDQLTGSWVFGTHRRSDAGNTSAYAAGRLDHLDSMSLEGALTAPRGTSATGLWTLATSGGKYANAILYSGFSIYHGGIFGGSQDTIIGWRINPSSSQTGNLAEISDFLPSEPSLFFAIRPMTFGP